MASNFPSSETTAWLNARLQDLFRQTTGVARQAQWIAEDGWLVAYTTSKVEGGPHDGYYLTLVYKTTGKGARAGKRDSGTGWELVKRERHRLRRQAKARALYWYGEHSPRWKARNQRYVDRELAR